MKLFLIDWRTNYGMDAIVMEANNEEEARAIADKMTTVWTGYSINEIRLTGIAGTITYTDHSS